MSFARLLLTHLHECCNIAEQFEIAEQCISGHEQEQTTDCDWTVLHSLDEVILGRKHLI